MQTNILLRLLKIQEHLHAPISRSTGFKLFTSPDNQTKHGGQDGSKVKEHLMDLGYFLPSMG